MGPGTLGEVERIFLNEQLNSLIASSAFGAAAMKCCMKTPAAEHMPASFKRQGHRATLQPLSSSEKPQRC